jgi:hypothetical protein
MRIGPLLLLACTALIVRRVTAQDNARAHRRQSRTSKDYRGSAEARLGQATEDRRRVANSRERTGRQDS